MRDRFEPSPKAARRIIGEFVQLSGQFKENILRHVLSVRFLKIPFAAPTEDFTPIVFYELPPGCLVARVERSRPRRDTLVPESLAPAMLITPIC